MIYNYKSKEDELKEYSDDIIYIPIDLKTSKHISFF